MLNEKGQRELAYIVKVDSISRIEGAERVELAIVGGWTIMVKKGQFAPGDYAIYFEIDSKVPKKAPFEFLEPKGYKVKTQKYFKGTVISQGLLMGLEDFEDAPWKDEIKKKLAAGENIEHIFLTDALGVKYSVEEDNQRKANSADKYKVMAQRRPNIFKKSWARWMMKREWGRKVMFFFFGKKKDKKSAWPDWVVKTDEERVQNIPHILKEDTTWIATEKVDGSSATYTVKKRGHKWDFYVCSRNVVQMDMEQSCYYDSNIYWEMAIKYGIKNKLIELAEFYNADWVTLQGEIYGLGVQRRDYSLLYKDFKAFNLIVPGLGRFNPIEMTRVLAPKRIPCVDIVSTDFQMPETVAELLEMAKGESKIDGGAREGLVFRSVDGIKSFKAVDNEFLMKYHG